MQRLTNRFLFAAFAAVCAFTPIHQLESGELAGFEGLASSGDVVIDFGGLDIDFVAGALVRSITTAGLATVQTCDADKTTCTDSTVQLSLGTGVSLSSGAYSATTQLLTLTLSDASTVDVSLAAVTTAAELQTAITSAIADRLTRSDLIEGANITLTPGTGNQVTIEAAAGADGVATGGTCVGNDMVMARSQGLSSITVQEACIGSGGGAGEVNVQANWAEADTSSDAYIENKPTIPDVSGFLTQTQVDARVTSGALQPANVAEGTNVTITRTADGVTIAAAGGSGGGLTSVSSDSTLQGLGTASDLLGLTDVEVNQLDSVPGLLAETADLSIEVISRTWTDGTDVAAGGFVSHGSGNAITVAEAAALTYFVTRAVTNADGLLNFVVIRVPDTVDLRDVRTRQRIGGGVDLYIDGWHRIGSAGGFTYAYSHNHLYSGYTARFQTSITLATTHFRGESDAENVTVNASRFRWQPERNRYRRSDRASPPSTPSRSAVVLPARANSASNRSPSRISPTSSRLPRR